MKSFSDVMTEWKKKQNMFCVWKRTSQIEGRESETCDVWAKGRISTVLAQPNDNLDHDALQD